jgi:hypothetical protein
MGGFEAFVKGASDFLTAQDTGGFAPSPPMTHTATSHSITLRTDQGLKIARIQQWSPTMARTVEQIFEVQANNTGEPVEQVAQVQNSNRISVDRYEMYTSLIGEAFGVPTVGQTTSPEESGSVNGNDLVSLVRQIKPFNVREIWRDPFGGIRAFVYAGVWFTDWGITISATDDRIIKARATLQFTRRLRLA